MTYNVLCTLHLVTHGVKGPGHAPCVNPPTGPSRWRPSRKAHSSGPWHNLLRPTDLDARWSHCPRTPPQHTRSCAPLASLESCSQKSADTFPMAASALPSHVDARDLPEAGAAATAFSWQLKCGAVRRATEKRCAS